MDLHWDAKGFSFLLYAESRLMEELEHGIDQDITEKEYDGKGEKTPTAG